MTKVQPEPEEWAAAGPNVLVAPDEEPYRTKAPVCSMKAEATQEVVMRSNDARRSLEAERLRLIEVKRSLEHDRLSDESQRRSTSELSGTDEHLADVASETATRESELSVLATVDAELAAVEAAIERVASGTYGICARCGSPIPDDRLAAVPATTFCLDDQGQAERARSMMDDHGCDRSMEHEALAHLDLLPQDDEDLSVGAEESAMAEGHG